MVALIAVVLCWVRARTALRGAAVLAGVLATRAAADAPSFPYVAYVVEGAALVRSGPAERYYATGELARGAAVEVYRHDGDGWCAIRPPQGSFSVVSAAMLRSLDPRVAEAIVDDMPVRVGSALAESRSAVQVKLLRGERVELIEPIASGSVIAKIAPPAGEFRWIAARSLSRQPPTENTPLPLPVASQWRAYGARRAAAASEPSDERRAIHETPAPQRNNFAHLQEASVASAEFDEPMDVVPGSPAAIQAAQYERDAAPAEPAPATDALAAPPLVADAAPAATSHAPLPAVASTTTGSVPAPSGVPRIRFPGLSATPVLPATTRIAELQLELSKAIAQPAGEWRLGGLREETATLLTAASAPVERDQLRTLLERIVKFEEIANQRAQFATATPKIDARLAATKELDVFDASERATDDRQMAITGQTDEIRAMVRRDLGLDAAGAGRGTTASATPNAADAAPQFAGTEARYDAVGTLKPVVSRRGGAPQFALVDDSGEIVSLVTAGPTVNLQQYVGQRIGVAGSRGFMAEYRRAHVTAARVSPLTTDDTIRR